MDGKLIITREEYMIRYGCISIHLAMALVRSHEALQLIGDTEASSCLERKQRVSESCR